MAVGCFDLKGRMMTTVELGDTVQDTITGLVGVVVSETTWLYGCVRLLIQPTLDKDGKVPDTYAMDKPQARLLSKRGADVPIVLAVEDPPAGDPSFIPKQR